jgi:Hsp70 protein
VRERVAELARAELGEVRDEWLVSAEQQHDLRLERPRAIVTIPAYFTNNQKHATRDACEIAGVDLVRMIHEPTAASMTAARERHLAGRIVVVDLGAGTLDLSFLEVDENAYDVLQVVGDTQFGGRDFDARIGPLLPARHRTARTSPAHARPPGRAGPPGLTSCPHALPARPACVRSSSAATGPGAVAFPALRSTAAGRSFPVD